MSTDTQVAPVATTEIPATELTNETPEVVIPETPEQTEATPEKDDRDKAIARMERRINRKHAEAAEAKAERDFYKQRAEQLEAQKEPEETQQVDPKQFERAVTQKAAELAKAREFDKQCNDVAAQGAKEFPDFQTAVNALVTELPLFEKNGAPTAAMQVILEAEKPSALMRYLGKNPDIASELADLTPTQLTRRLDRIEREMANPKTSAAPTPLTPVKGAAVGGDLNDDLPLDEWLKRRNKAVRTR